MALMSLRVWPRAPWSDVNETSNVVNINDRSAARGGVDDHDNNDDNNNDDAINNGGGTSIPERQQLRQGQLRRFGGNGGDNGNCEGHGNNKEGDMVMRQ